MARKRSSGGRKAHRQAGRPFAAPRRRDLVARRPGCAAAAARTGRSRRVEGVLAPAAARSGRRRRRLGRRPRGVLAAARGAAADPDWRSCSCSTSRRSTRARSRRCSRACTTAARRAGDRGHARRAGPRLRDPAERPDGDRRRPSAPEPAPERPHAVHSRSTSSCARSPSTRRTARSAWSSRARRPTAPGIREIKAAGRHHLRAGPETAKYDGMPRAAIATGMVDLVLSPARDRAPSSSRSRATPTCARAPRSARRRRARRRASEHLERIFALLRAASGVDFRHYKRPTIQRRLQRRMVLHRLDERRTTTCSYLEENPAEVAALYQDILIHVTRFFRDPESFEALATHVFPHAHRRAARDDEPIRIWVPAARPARRPTRSRSRCSSTSATRADACRSRSSPPTSARRRSSTRAAASTRRASPPTSRPSGCGASSRKVDGGYRDQQGGARPVRLRAAGPDARPAVLQARPDRLPQRADLPGRRRCSSKLMSRLPLRAEADAAS